MNKVPFHYSKNIPIDQKARVYSDSLLLQKQMPITTKTLVSKIHSLKSNHKAFSGCQRRAKLQLFHSVSHVLIMITLPTKFTRLNCLFLQVQTRLHFTGKITPEGEDGNQFQIFWSIRIEDLWTYHRCPCCWKLATRRSCVEEEETIRNMPSFHEGW